MSTYLVAFIVGPLDVTDPVDVDGTPLRVVYPPGKGHLTAYALEVGAFCLRFFADYFGLPYPGDKVDLVAVPDFAFGAMENLGCITFREALLLVDPAEVDPARAAERDRRDRPRAGPHVVRRPGHHEVVERHLAERGLRHLHGDAGHRRLQARVGALGRPSA